MVKTRLRLDRNRHANRKFEKVIQFSESGKNAVAGKAISKEKVQRERSRRKKLNAFDLSSLAECLPDLKSPSRSKPAEFKLNSITRYALVLRESFQLKSIINHPKFAFDPLGVIHRYLQNTQPRLRKRDKERLQSLASNVTSMTIG